MIIELTDMECRIAEMIACARYNENRKAGSSNLIDELKGSHDHLLYEIIGFKAEMAFAKKYNIYPDLEIHCRSGSYDLLINDKRVDIKATMRPNGQLLVHRTKSKKESDIYVLAVVNGNVIDFKGWLQTEECFAEENIKDLGHGPTYAIPQDKLRRFK